VEGGDARILGRRVTQSADQNKKFSANRKKCGGEEKDVTAGWLLRGGIDWGDWPWDSRKLSRGGERSRYVSGGAATKESRGNRGARGLKIARFRGGRWG